MVSEMQFPLKVLINPPRSKFSRNLIFYVSWKFNLSSIVGIFIRIFHKENFVVITPFKSGTNIFAVIQYFLELINSISKDTLYIINFI